jgi:hypothetical protein
MRTLTRAALNTRQRHTKARIVGHRPQISLPLASVPLERPMPEQAPQRAVGLASRRVGIDGLDVH